MPALIRENVQSLTPQDIRQAEEASEQLIAGRLDLSVVPGIALRLFQDILNELAQGHTVAIQKIETYLTTNEAAEYLNVSRPYVIKLLKEGKLPCSFVGSHRRIRYDELQEYKKNQTERSYQLMAELQEQAQELNMGY